MSTTYSVAVAVVVSWVVFVVELRNLRLILEAINNAIERVAVELKRRR